MLHPLASQQSAYYADVLLKFMAEAVIITDQAQRIIYWNEAATTLYGWSEAEAIGQPINELLRTDWADAAGPQAEADLARSGVWRGELCQQTRAGAYLFVDTAISQTKDELGHVTGLVIVNRDITERKRAEELLSQNKAYLDSLIDSQTAFLLRTDLTGKITFVNARFEALYAPTHPHLIGLSIEDTILPSDHEKTVAAVEQCLANPGQPVQVILRKPAADGRIFWTLWEFVTVKDSDNVVREIQCVGFDITEQMQAEAALRESNARQQAMLSAIPDLLFRIRSDGVYLDCHAPQPELLLWPREQFIGKHIREVLPDHLAPRLLSAIGQALLERRPVQTDYSLELPHGLHEFEARIVPTNPTEVLVLVRDVTEERQAQRAINLHTTALAAAANAIVITDHDGVVEWVNPAFTTLTGYTLVAVQGQSLSLLKSGVHDDAFYQDLWQTVLSGQVWQGRITNRRKDGTLYVEEQTITPVYNRAGEITHFIAIKQDVTERERSEQLQLERERLRANLKKEQELNALVKKAVTALSHDVRNPLTVIANAKQMLVRYFDRLDVDKRREKLDLIGKQLQYVLELLNDMTLVVSGSLNQVDLKPSLVSLPALCLATIEQIKATMGGNHRFQFVSDGRIDYVELDETLVSRILLNLLSNAVKFSPAGSEIRLEVDRSEAWLIFRVVDAGMGIDEADLPHIFEPFYRSEAVRTVGGTGLGLNIVKECVERHQGQVSVESQPGEGSTFTVALPLALT